MKHARASTPLFFSDAFVLGRERPDDGPPCRSSLVCSLCVPTSTVAFSQGEAAGEGDAAGTASENNLIINYLPSHVTEIELRVSLQGHLHLLSRLYTQPYQSPPRHES